MGNLSFGPASSLDNKPAPIITAIHGTQYQMIIKGLNLADVNKVTLTNVENGVSKEFKVTKASVNQLIIESLSTIAIPIGALLDMTLTSAYGQAQFPIHFILQPDSVRSINIKDGAATRLKLNKEPTDRPLDGAPLVWSTVNNSFIFGLPGSGGGSGGVSGISFGPGIFGEGSISTATVVPVSVNTGEYGIVGETIIPYFGTNNKIVLDSSLSTGGNFSGLRLKDNSGHFDIFNDGSLVIEKNPGGIVNELLRLDYSGRLNVEGDIFSRGSQVCTVATGCSVSVNPGIVTSVTALPPLVATGTNDLILSATTGTAPGNLVQLEGSGTPGVLPAVDGSQLLNVVTSVLPGTAISVSPPLLGAVTVGLIFGSTGNAQQWQPRLDNLGVLPTNANGVIIGNDSGNAFVVESGVTLLGSILGTPSVNSYEFYNGNNWVAEPIPNCPSGSVIMISGNKFVCSTSSSTIEAGTFISNNQEGISILPNGANTGELRFRESAGGVNYVGFKAPSTVATSTIWTLPTSDGIPGQVLSTNGSGSTVWSSLPSTVNNVTNAATSTDNAIMRFDGTTGKLAQNSGVIIDDSNNVTGMGTLNTRTIANWVEKSSNFTAANRVALAGGANRILSETGYTIPTTVCTNGQILKSNGTNMGCSADNDTTPSDSIIGIYRHYPRVCQDASASTANPPVMSVANANCIFSANLNWNAQSYLPNPNYVTTGTPFYFDNTATMSTTINTDRTTMSSALTLATNQIAVFMYNAPMGAYDLIGVVDRRILPAANQFNSLGNSFTLPTTRGTSGSFPISNGLGASSWSSGFFAEGTSALPVLRVTGDTDSQQSASLFLTTTVGGNSTNYGYKILYDATNTVDGLRINEIRAGAETTFMLFDGANNLINIYEPLVVESGDYIRFPHANATDTNDGKIGAGLFGEGLNIVGVQTVIGNGRLTRVWGNLNTVAGDINAAGNITATGNATITGTLTQGCPGNWTAIKGGRLCMITAIRGPATVLNARSDCINNTGGRVCTFGDLSLACAGGGASLVQGNMWIGDFIGDDTFGITNNSCNNGNFDGPVAGSGATTAFYRCCF